MTKGENLRNIAIEVVNIDEHLAEQAVRTATQMLVAILPLQTDTLHVEPHDDIRGVWARVDMENPEKISASFDKCVVSVYKALINMQLHNVSSTVVHVLINETRDEEM